MVSLFLCLNGACGIVYHQVKWYLVVSAEEGRIETDGRKVFSTFQRTTTTIASIITNFMV